MHSIYKVLLLYQVLLLSLYFLLFLLLLLLFMVLLIISPNHLFPCWFVADVHFTCTGSACWPPPQRQEPSHQGTSQSCPPPPPPPPALPPSVAAPPWSSKRRFSCWSFCWNINFIWYCCLIKFLTGEFLCFHSLLPYTANLSFILPVFFNTSPSSTAEIQDSQQVWEHHTS